MYDVTTVIVEHIVVFKSLNKAVKLSWFRLALYSDHTFMVCCFVLLFTDYSTFCI